MVTETRNQQFKRYKEEVDYIIGEVLDQEDNSDIHRALQKYNYKNLMDMVSSSDSEINALDFIDDKGNVTELKKYDLAKVCLFRDFYHSCKQTGHTFSNIGDWKKITCEEYGELRTNAPTTSTPKPSNSTGNHSSGNHQATANTPIP